MSSSSDNNILDIIKSLKIDTKNLVHIKRDLIGKIYDNIFTYDIKYILSFLNIKESIKKIFSEEIKHLNIYTKKNNNDKYGIFTIKYIHNSKSLYEFNIVVSNDKLYPLLMIKKDNIQYTKYNIIKEFKSYNFKQINDGSLYNYISLFIKEDELKFGIILVGYFFINHYLSNHKNLEDLNKIINQENVLKIKLILNKNLEYL